MLQPEKSNPDAAKNGKEGNRNYCIAIRSVFRDKMTNENDSDEILIQILMDLPEKGAG
jgi:hypothetical protein